MYPSDENTDGNKLTIPNSPESERAVLGSIIIDPRLMNRINHIITYRDFYFESYRLIFRAMEKLHKDRSDIDVLSLADLLKKHGYLDKIGGPMELTQLSNDVPTAAHIVTHARLVADRAVLRNMIYAAQDVVKMAATGTDDMEQLLQKAEQRMKGVTRTSARTEERLTTVDIETWRQIARDTNTPAGTVRGLSSGFKGLDDLLEGIEAGEMIIITGHTKHGKSRLAMNIAINIAQADKKVLYINTEMTKLQTARRINQIMGEQDLVGTIEVNDRAGLDYNDVIHLMERAKEHGFDLVIVDHLHFFSRSVENQTNEISKITKEFKDAAVEFELPLIMLAHVSQSATKLVPTLQSLKNSSSIAQDADVVITVWIDDRPTGDPTFTDVVRLAHRSAERSVRKIRLYNDGMRMTEQAPETNNDERVAQYDRQAALLGENDDDISLADLGPGWGDIDNLTEPKDKPDAPGTV